MRRARWLPALLRGAAVVVLVATGAGRAAHAWDSLLDAVALLPQPVQASATTPIFGYGDLARLREDGELSRLLTVGWPNLFAALDSPEPMPQFVGVVREGVRRILHAGSPRQPFVIAWGGAGFTAAADERLVARGFSVETLGEDRLYARRPDDHVDVAADPRDPFDFGGQPQRLLAFDEALAGAAEVSEMRALHERHLGGERSALARGLLATIAPIRAGLPQGIVVLQAAAFWPDSFLTGESDRRARDPERPVLPLPPGTTAFSRRLPAFAFALFIAAELQGSPVLMVAVAYESAQDAAAAAPVIAAGVQALGTGEGPAPTRVHDWAFAGNGLHVALATVLFGDAPRARASTALRHWLELVDARAFTPLDVFH